jgi:hypothetical protein
MEGGYKMKGKRIIFIFLLLLLISLTGFFALAQSVGYIQIKCEPGAAVFLDNNFVGNTSLELGGLILQDISAGSHEVKIVKEGFKPHSVKIDLKVNEIYVYEVKLLSEIKVTQSGETQTDLIKPKVGSLLIETIPLDCIIEIPLLNIDKEYEGNKTEKIWEVSAIPIGSYRINFLALGKKVKYDLEIEEGVQKHLLVNILSNKVEEIAPPITIGDTGPAGGFIFYDKGSYSDGRQYLEAAPVSTEWTDKQWGSYGTEIEATGTGIGTGQSNTTKIVTWLNSQGEAGKAAQLCDALVVENNGGTYSDWFLPSFDELNLIYTNLKVSGVGGFVECIYYWSSSECNANLAWSQYFCNGSQGFNYKYYANRVRAVRAF